MKKLNNKKAQWIVKEMDNEEKSVYRIAKTMNVTPQWDRDIHKICHKTRQYPYPHKPGRKSRPISEEKRRTIIETSNEHSIRSCHAKKYIDKHLFFKVFKAIFKCVSNT